MKTMNFMIATALVAALALVGCSNENSVTGDAKVNKVLARFIQVERMAIPALNTVLIPSMLKDSYNQGAPANDVADFLGTAEATLNALRAAVNAVPGFPPEDADGISAEALAAFLIPDVVTIDFSKPVQFPNGRRLQDDVIDAEVGLVLNRGSVLSGGPGISDGINVNDAAFLASFPYLAAAN